MHFYLLFLYFFRMRPRNRCSLNEEADTRHRASKCEDQEGVGAGEGGVKGKRAGCPICVTGGCWSFWCAA